MNTGALLKPTLVGLVVAASAVFALGPAAAPAAADDVGSGYDESQIRDLLWATDYLGFSGPDELQRAGVLVINFILRTSREIESSCEAGLGAVIDSFGKHRYATVWIGEELVTLDWVANHYCISREQAQTFGATLLTFLSGLDAAGKGVETTKPPIPEALDFVPVVLAGFRTANTPLAVPLPSDYQIAVLSHTGRNAFRVRGLDAEGRVLETLLERIGQYRGTVLVSEPERFSSLVVEADGEWEVSFLPIAAANRFGQDRIAFGSNDDVLYLTDSSAGGSAVTFRHDGSMDFQVDVIEADGQTVVPLVAGSGVSTTLGSLPVVTRVISVKADGAWRLSATSEPSLPSGLTAERDGDEIVLDWIAPNAASRSQIEGYSVGRSIDGGEVWSPVGFVNSTSGQPPETIFRTVGHARGTREDFRVSAVTADGVGPPSEVTTVYSACQVTRGVLQDLRRSVLEDKVGLADYETSDLAEIPKATAALLIAESRCVSESPSHDRSVLDALGDQLLSWPERFASERYGWGLPFEWDAFDDGSTNPENTVYSISTGLSIKALLDWAAVSNDEIRFRIYSVVERALDEWLDDDALSDAGQFVYSLNSFDYGYDVFNSSAMLAGQMQRAADLGFASADLYRDKADVVVQSLIDHHQHGLKSVQVVLGAGEDLSIVASQFGVDSQIILSASGLVESDIRAGTLLTIPDAVDSGWYWDYSTLGLVPNDLAHAGYIVDGISTYSKHGGRLASSLPLDLVAKHLLTFMGNQTVHEQILRWPVWLWHWRSAEENKEYWWLPRLYEIGWGIFVSSANRDILAPLETAACEMALRYRHDAGSFLKFPRLTEMDGMANSQILEYSAYLYLGLTHSRCSYTFEGGDVNGRGEEYQLVPFTTLGETDGLTADLWIDTRSGRARLQAGQRVLNIPRAGVPLGLVAEGETFVSVIREVPSSRLTFASWEGDTFVGDAVIPGQDDVSLMLRAIHQTAESLFLVVYDNKTRENRLQRYDWQNLELLREWVLPLIQPEAGQNYQLEPPIHFVAGHDGKLRFVGGTLHGTVNGDVIEYGRLTNCSKALEAVAGSGSKLFVLCEAQDPDVAVRSLIYLGGDVPDRSGGFTLSVVDGDQYEYSSIQTLGVPYRLRPREVFLGTGREVEVVWSDSAVSGLVPFLEYEISRGQNSGTLELGVNNDEGRIAWSQIYYLNAFLDIVRMHSHWVVTDEVLEIVGLLSDRLRIEMELLETILDQSGMASRAFTVDRSPSVFAVQTSRLALLYDGYLEYYPAVGRYNPTAIEISRDSVSLVGHMEVLTDAAIPSWSEEGQSHLMWPKGSAFMFDGLNVPFNHQNEWALSIVRSNQNLISDATWDAAEDILGFFYDQILVPEREVFPDGGVWPYWWGTAWDGWAAEDEVSLNTPTYAGDRGDSWISFRTIDAEAMVEWSDHLAATAGGQLLDNIAGMVQDGVVLPYIAAALVEHGVLPAISESTFGRFGRAGSPSELPAMVWAHVLRGR